MITFGVHEAYKCFNNVRSPDVAFSPSALAVFVRRSEHFSVPRLGPGFATAKFLSWEIVNLQQMWISKGEHELLLKVLI